MIKISPSILSSDFSKLGEEILSLEKAGADLIHIDVMDGNYVPNITFGPPVIKSIRKYTKLPFDVHLMIDKPEKYIEDFVKAGADIITVHPEATIHLHKTLMEIKSYGKVAGVALNPGTSSIIIKDIIKYIDMVLLMSVNPGFGGQSFIIEVLSKIKELRKYKEKLILEIDGGINEKTSILAKEAGIDILVAGSYIFKGSYKERIEKLKNNKGVKL